MRSNHFGIKSHLRSLEDSENTRLDFVVFPLSILANKRLSVNARLLWCVLSKFCIRKSECTPTVEMLSEEMGIGRRTVFKSLGQLVQAGLVVRKQRFRRSTIYKLRT